MDQTLMALMGELRHVLQRERLLRKTAEELAAALQQNHAVLVAELLHLQARVRELEAKSSRMERGAISGYPSILPIKAAPVHFNAS